MKYKILVIDDEKEMRDLLFQLISKQGYTVISAEDANEGYEKIKVSKPDLILLDLKLPDMSGFQFCQFLKNDSKTKNIPVIMLTSVDKTLSKISGLEIGADDYVTKPFDNKELLARIKAILRRALREETKPELFTSGTLSLDPEKHTVTIGKETVDLGPKEFELLYMLMKGNGKLFTRHAILESIWGFEYLGTTRTVDVHIRYIRRKLKNHAKKIVSIKGIGYKFLK